MTTKDFTTTTLREMLLSEISLIQDGTSNPARLRSITGACSVIIKSREIDLMFEQYGAKADARSIGAVSLR